MSTALAERPSKPRKFLARMPVKFNNANLGDEIGSLGFSTARENCSLEIAEQCFCGKRTNIRIVVGAGDAAQAKFWEDLQWDVQAVADVKSFRCSPKRISAGLAFSMSGVDVSVLARFAKQDGWLYVLNAEEIGDDPTETEGEEAEADEGDEQE